MAASWLPHALFALLCLSPNDSDSEQVCTLVSRELHQALERVILERSQTTQEAQATWKAMRSALHDHREGHAWAVPFAVDLSSPEHPCSARELHQLVEPARVLAGLGDCITTKELANIFVRNGDPKTAVGLLTAVAPCPGVPGPGLPRPGGVTAPETPPAPPASEVPSHCNLARHIGDIRRMEGRWREALEAYTVWEPVSWCGNGFFMMRTERAELRLECLAQLGRWNGYRTLCLEEIASQTSGGRFATHLVEWHRVQGSTGLAAADVEARLTSLLEFTYAQRGVRDEYQARLEAAATEVRRTVQLHLSFLEMERSRDLAGLPDLLDQGLHTDVVLNGLLRMGEAGIQKALTAAESRWETNHASAYELMKVLARTAHPFVGLHLDNRPELYEPRTHRSLRWTWQQARKRVPRAFSPNRLPGLPR